MFLTYLLWLLAGAFVPIVLFSSVEILGLTGLTPMRLAPGCSPAHRVAKGAWTVTQAYVWLGWAAYCAALGLGYALDPHTANPWAYISVSLFATGLPIAYLRVKERLTSESDVDDQQFLQGSNFWRIVVLSGCLCFLIAPQLITRPYGWLASVAPKMQAEVDLSRETVVGAGPGRTATVAPLPASPGLEEKTPASWWPTLALVPRGEAMSADAGTPCNSDGAARTHSAESSVALNADCRAGAREHTRIND